VKVDVRVIAATNRDLEAAYKVGTFRKDLYFRLNVVTVQIPPLRERRSDMVALVRSFLSRYGPDENIQVTPAAMTCLFQYDWPGNVRELENCIERAIALGNHRLIDVLDLPAAIRATASGISLPAPELIPTPGAATDLEQIERETILRVFQQVGGDKVQAGKMLGISRATLYRKLKRYNIEPRSAHAAAAAAPVPAGASLRAE
jgi:transcriptional regulator with PAS, ATPase and Fis domain